MSRLYVGNLPPDVRHDEVSAAHAFGRRRCESCHVIDVVACRASAQVERLFDKFGRIAGLDVKVPAVRGGAAFAFLEYADPRDAEVSRRGTKEACRHLASPLSQCRLRWRWRR